MASNSKSLVFSFDQALFSGSISRLVHSAAIVPRDAAGVVLEQPCFKYSIILAALLRKNELYKMVGKRCLTLPIAQPQGSC